MTSIQTIATRFAEFWRIYKRNRTGTIGIGIFIGIVIIASLSSIISPYDPFDVTVAQRFLSPGPEFIFGTDELGRDVLSRFLRGATVSLLVGFSAAGSSTFIGVIVGMVSGFSGGRVDDVLMRITEVFQVIPRFFLALVVVAIFGQTIWNIVFAIGILSWPQTARLVRSEFLTLKSRPYVDAARSFGAGYFTLIFSEILPNATAIVIVSSTLLMGDAMLLEAGLSYLGLGDPNSLSWGLLLFQAQPYLRLAWWLAAFPGIGIFLTVLALNLVGDALNDAFNPRQRGR